MNRRRGTRRNLLTLCLALGALPACGDGEPAGVTPAARPTAAPTARPTAEPTAAPTARPTAEPAAAPTAQPHAAPAVDTSTRSTAAPVAPAADDAPPFRFTDVSAAAGVAFTTRSGASGEKLLPETMGGGVAFLDHDADGDADLLLVGGATWAWDDPAPDEPSSLALFENDGAGVFTDATVAAGLDRRLHGMGVAVSDVEGDGDDDVYVTAVGPNVLFRNEGGHFVDGTDAAGVAGGADDWSTAATFLDVELDGDLDLLVGNYVRWSREIDLAGDRRLVGIPGRAYAPPMAFEGTQPSLFVNRGDGVFDERGVAAGLHVTGTDGAPVAKTLAFHVTDLDDDRDPDVFVANDTTANQLFVNAGDGTFLEEAQDRGLAYDHMGRPTGAMGVDGAPLDDGRPALYVGNFADEMSSAYVGAPGGAFFDDRVVATGLGPDTRPALTFGVLLLDVDLDGRLDLLQVNGHLEPAVDGAPGEQTYAQAPQLFRGLAPDDDGVPRFEAVPSAALGDLAVPIPGRGAACADVDGDGDLDLVLTQVDGPARLLRNDGAPDAHWLRVALVGRPGFPGAQGAVVEVEDGGRVQRRRVDTTRGYLAQCERTLTFGLGDATTVDALRVTWPDGTTSEVDATVDRLVTAVQPVGPEEVQRVLNLAKAQLEAGRLAEALATLGTAVQLAPESAPTRRNLARARLAANDPAGALEALDAADALEPGDLAATWLRAMAQRRQGRDADALPLLEEVVRRDPALAAARFQLALALQALGRGDDALVQLEAATELDAGHAAAHYQLAVARRRAGDMDGFRASNRDFLRLRELYGDDYDTPLRLEACRLTEAEPAGGAVAAAGGRTPAPPSVEIAFVAERGWPRGGDGIAPTDGAASGGVTSTEGAAPDGASNASPAAVDTTAVALLSADAAGAATLLVARRDGSLLRLEPDAAGDHVARTVATGLGDLSDVAAIAVGNFLDDAPETIVPGSVPPRLPDVFLVGPTTARLLQQRDDGTFEDVTEGSGLEGATGRHALWVDHEHDGDLDLAVVGDAGLTVFVNVNDGTFVPSTEVPAVTGPAAHVAAVDLDDNGAVDLAVVTSSATVRIDNRNAGRFVRLPDPPGDWPATRRVLLEDVDLDGRADGVLVGDDGVRFVFDGAPGAAQAIPVARPHDAALLDPDGDGWLDLVIVGEDSEGRGAVALLRNGGRGAWTDATATWGLDAWVPGSGAPGAGAPGAGATGDAPAAAPASSSDDPAAPSAGAPPPLLGVLAADLDADGDADLLLADASGALHRLRNDGGEARPLLTLRLLSLMSPSGAIGARVEVRDGGFYTSRIIQDAGPVALGVGGRDTVDSVLVVWPYGVVDTRTDVATGAGPVPIVVLEKADTGSCPFLFLWDGERMRFIDDMVGSGATDLPLDRATNNPVNPHEIIRVGPATDFPLVDGAWKVSITSELREVAYYDEAELLVVDHPVGMELASTHRLRGPPFPENRVLALGDRVPLRAALGDDGLDRTAALAERDGVHAPPGAILPPPLRGQTLPHALELDFGPLDTDAPLVLVLSGFIEFGTASTMIALSQRDDVTLLWPALEARDGDGTWHALDDVVVGLPGGKTRDVTLELDGLLPPGADRLRLTTTFELHWDRAALFRSVPLAADAITPVRPTSAELAWRGFSDLRVRAPGQPRRPDYHVVSQEPPWRTNLSGWCTAYGDVLPLMEAEDGKLVVLASGDELRLRLPADGLPPVPEGATRTLMWRSVGYNKEADPNNNGRGHVWPLGPDISYGRTPEEDDAWRLRWNTRWVPPDAFRDVGGTR